MTKTPGLDQSQAHAQAARTLSLALGRQQVLARKIARTDRDEKANLVQEAKDAATAVTAARKVLRDAYLAYTNPFGVKKTV